MRKKRTCNGCKAIRHDGVCEFNYKTVEGKIIGGRVVSYNPVTECPKPTTSKQYVSLMLREVQ